MMGAKCQHQLILAEGVDEANGEHDAETCKSFFTAAPQCGDRSRQLRTTSGWPLMWSRRCVVLFVAASLALVVASRYYFGILGSGAHAGASTDGDQAPVAHFHVLSDADADADADAEADADADAGACAKDYGDDCHGKVCCNEYVTCFEKNDGWAGCKPTCTLGAPEEAPPWDPNADMLPWSCEVLGTKPDPPKWKRNTADPSMYCFVMALVQGYEPELLRRQLATGTGIFSCNEWSIFSERAMMIGMGPDGWVKSTAIGGPMTSVGRNTPEFLRAWHKIREEGLFHDFKYTAKIDPDTFLIAGVLQIKLRDVQGLTPETDAFYFKNCKKWISVQGPLELFSRAAAQIFFGGLEYCRSQKVYMERGEDWFFGHCVDGLKIRNIEDYSLLADQYCEGEHTCSTGKPAYHPFKTVESYMACLEEAL